MIRCLTFVKKKVNIVWFKRDLRLRDQLPLKLAIEDGLPILLIYLFEPSILKDPHYDIRHWRFVHQSLVDLNSQLSKLDSKILILQNEAIPVFEKLNELVSINKVFSYQETGLKITYDRDKQFSSFCKKENIQWLEYQQNGVERSRKNRVNWQANWHKFMEQPLDQPNWENFTPFNLEAVFSSIFTIHSLPETYSDQDKNFQEGGETKAWAYLRSFYNERAKNYSNHISKPYLSRKGCSRLSPYIAWGNLSIRQVYQKYLEASKKQPYKRALNNFSSRLCWHCHFIQKFEMADRMEFKNINSGYNDLKRKFEPQHYLAWKRGQTGFPLVDACMRCLIETGYINFRMRAMVLSFLTHNLWQHWKEGAIWLASQFLDFEPGIHYPQVQMQAGVTGINTVRIYNPIKQSKDNDKEGIFIKKYIPELKNLPIEFIHEPWLMTAMEQQLYGVEIGKDYPAPIIDLKSSSKEARDKIWAKKKEAQVRKESFKILKRHTLPRRKMQ